MKPVELIEKLMSAKCDFAESASVKLAVSGFLASLTAELQIELPKGCLEAETYNDRGLFYAGVIVGYAKEIGDEQIRNAHKAMLFPSNRAIISRLLYGPGPVTALGVPSSYGVS